MKDTVQPYNEYENTGTGFSFANYNAHEMLGTIRYAERIFYDKKRDWNKMVERAMDVDFSWKSSPQRNTSSYIMIYYKKLKTGCNATITACFSFIVFHGFL